MLTPINYTMQEAFDIIAKHLLTQMVRCEVHNECQYRGNDGTMCAVGALIPDDRYDEDYEGHPGAYVLNLVEVWIDNKPLAVNDSQIPTGATAKFIDQVQTIHDTYPPRLWHHQLNMLAVTRGLSTNVLDQFNTQDN